MMISLFLAPVNSLLDRYVLSNLRQLLWQRFGLRYQFKSGLNVKIESRAEWSIYNEIFVDGEYDLPIKRLLEAAPNNRPLNVLDLGANVGYFSLRVADLLLQSKSPQIPCQLTLVEGAPPVYKKLKSRIGREVALTGKTRIINGLVGERKGSAKIFVADFHVSNSLYIAHPSGKNRSIDVPYIDLYSLYDDDDIIDLLKCDIEGAEIKFIENYQELLSRVRAAVFEFHYNICDIDRCCKLLKEAGFVNHEKLREESPGTSLDLFWK